MMIELSVAHRGRPWIHGHGARLAVIPSLALAFLGAAVPRPAYAVDGCRVLLCLAAPDWRSVQECVPTIRQLMHDLARGKSFSTCNMAGSGNNTHHDWANAPTYCPPQYTHVFDGEHDKVFTCDYSGAITVSVGGELFARTWWTPGGDTVTEFSPTAKTQLGSWNTRFDDDYAVWVAAQPPSPVAVDASH